ncbi:MAG: ABC transporter permease [Flavobacteriales bacterium]|nr:ABC transporter permease [Flavobacteriales bacterium]
MSTEQKSVRIISPDQPFTEWVKQLVERHETLWFFIWKDLKVQYNRPLFGFLWSIFQPLVYFGIILAIMDFTGRTGTDTSIPFPVYLICGLAIWNFATASILGAMNSIQSNAGIISKSSFPRFYLILAPLLKAGMDLMIVLLIVLVIALFYGVSIPLHAVYSFPIMLTILLISAVGLASIVATMVILNQQIRHAIPVLLYAGIFILPIFYSMETIGNNWLQRFYQINPIAGSMECLRASLGDTFPSMQNTLYWVLSAVVLCVIGIIFFRRIEKSLADKV